jgi:hypothetical protein
VLNIPTNCGKIIFSFPATNFLFTCFKVQTNLYEVPNNVKFEFVLQFNSITPELNRSGQHCLPRFLLGILILKVLTSLRLYKSFVFQGLRHFSLLVIYKAACCQRQNNFILSLIFKVIRKHYHGYFSS